MFEIKDHCKNIDLPHSLNSEGNLGIICPLITVHARANLGFAQVIFIWS